MLRDKFGPSNKSGRGMARLRRWQCGGTSNLPSHFEYRAAYFLSPPQLHGAIDHCRLAHRYQHITIGLYWIWGRKREVIRISKSSLPDHGVTIARGISMI